MIFRNKLYRLTRNLAFINGDLREEVPILKLQTETRWTFTFQSMIFGEFFYVLIRFFHIIKILFDFRGETT
ncbi:hypothetical protein C6W19_18960 [Bacillus sp. RJGP41]|nr:hypothetical protein C6W19_18960 [Bacillus sp. RJGP41]